MTSINKYCNSLTKYSRFLTREVSIGDLKIGGLNPIRVQSMTTTDTMDTIATVEQSIRMINAGCELVRITAPSMNEAKNLEVIKKELVARGYNTPICADIHFTPNAAEFAAKVIEKVRVNPGNYADKKKFESIDYTDSSYESELERIRNRFTPLVKICKEYGTAMRIGTNHGSLSDRILSRYGDTPLGMVESALEFLRICEDNNYFNIVISMKASNTQVMVQAYRLLVAKMIETNRNYPLHLGVTEAGDGEDGRIKSAVGIGTLLEDGLGDTIRVSLTEEPEYEIPVAKLLADRYSERKNHQAINEITTELPYNPFEFNRNITNEIINIGNHNVPRVIADYSMKPEVTAASLFGVGYNYSVPLDKWNLTDMAVDYLFLGDNKIDFEIPGTLGLIYNSQSWLTEKNKNRSYPLFCGEEYFETKDKSSELNFVAVTIDILSNEFIQKIKNEKTVCLVLDSFNKHTMPELRRMAIDLKLNECKLPFVVKCNYNNLSEEKFQLYSSTDIGGLFLDGFGDGIWIKQKECVSTQICNSTAFGILQATRSRISKTEYISCPSCGRTLFDLQETTQKIRERTDHLKGIKIGIMGCIVNGPGEMADADYGYVGTGVGKISLYKGKEVVKKNVTSETAVDELIGLIKEHGDWVEKLS
ncbi:MAG: (E)-4-hydroxy-3-methylbut-2-enyl-diphosphate synthase [Bacteroidota bacterium]|nr:(E)-4-hydroxy-3-methylbut-2-enyl-diphosphate synthase [Bacteroidota bacterium]MDP3145532.1 (E)-4-hydroxy-3-methylbut-2-enyl-diphosphate synthase [Bacteroidota bacterium]MDP3556492.1 (E)-4-hydroxy-3-methylbut-2-enyl-diphosphate synthase [Bacteroidota bacterium]